VSELLKPVLKNMSDPKQKEYQQPHTAAVVPAGLIKNVIDFSNRIKDKILVIKLSAAIIDNDELLTNFAENVHLINSCGARVCIVHDHGSIVSDILQSLGFDEKIINNTKVADHKSTQIIEMVVSGYINKLIVSKFCSLGCNAVGISGKDGNLIQAKKSKLLYKKVSEPDIIDIGFISEPIIVNPEILMNFEENNIIPVISPIASDENGRTHLLDVNLTTAIVSSALDADHLILPCEERILDSKDLTYRDIDMLQKILNSRSSNPKISNIIKAAITAIENSTHMVHFVNPKMKDSVLLAVFQAED